MSASETSGLSTKTPLVISWSRTEKHDVCNLSMNANNYEQRWLDLNSQKLGTDTVILYRRGILYSVYLWFWKTFSYFSVFRSMFLFLRKYGDEMSRAELSVWSIPAPTWPRRIGGAESADCPIPISTKEIIIKKNHTRFQCLWSRRSPPKITRAAQLRTRCSLSTSC